MDERRLDVAASGQANSNEETESGSVGCAQKALKRQIHSAVWAWQAMLRSVQAAMNILDGPLPLVPQCSPEGQYLPGHCFWNGSVAVRFVRSWKESTAPPQPSLRAPASAVAPANVFLSTNDTMEASRYYRNDIWQNIRRSHCTSYKRMSEILEGQRALLKSIHL